jgi:hypothetical protein
MGTTVFQSSYTFFISVKKTVVPIAAGVQKQVQGKKHQG